MAPSPGKVTLFGSRSLLLGSILFCSPSFGSAQEVVRIPDQHACACELRAQLVTTLSDDDGRAGLSQPLVIESTPSGVYLVVPANRQGAVLKFDSAGRFVGQVGNPGRGPKEFTGVIGIRPGLADSLLVMDAGNHRVAVLDPGLKIVRTARLPVSGSGWFGVVSDGSLVVLMPIPRGSVEDRIGVFDPQMNQVRAFMPSEPARPGRPIEDLRRRLAVSPDGKVAVAHNDRYAIEVWNASGDWLKTLIRETPWTQYPPSSTPSVDGKPSVRVEAPRIEELGRIWTVTHVPDADWRAALDSEGKLREGAQNLLMDSVVELLDPVGGTLLGSLRVDAHLTFISDDGLAASYRQDELGLPYIDIWRFTLENTGGAEPNISTRPVPNSGGS